MCPLLTSQNNTNTKQIKHVPTKLHCYTMTFVGYPVTHCLTMFYISSNIGMMFNLIGPTYEQTSPSRQPHSSVITDLSLSDLYLSRDLYTGLFNCLNGVTYFQVWYFFKKSKRYICPSEPYFL